MTALQFDLETPVNVPALGGLTLAQAMEVFNTLQPLGNIGGIIVGSGASNAHPNVTLNPRFTRYIWLDTQAANAVVLKLYQGTYPSDTYADWTTSTIANNSITAAKLADYAVSVLNTDGDPKIAYKQDASADATKSNYLLRLDGNGQFVEVVAASTVVGALTLNPAKLDVSTASDGWVLTYDSGLGQAIWKAITISGLISANSISYDKLVNGTIGVGALLRANLITGVWEAIPPNDLSQFIFDIRSIRLNRLASSGASLYDQLYFDATNWSRYTPFYGAPTVGGTVVPDPTTGALLSAPHALGAVPRDVKCYLINNSTDRGYSAGDIVDGQSLMTVGSGGEARVAITVHANSSTVFAAFGSQGAAVRTYKIVDKASFAVDTIAPAKWDVKLFASF